MGYVGDISFSNDSLIRISCCAFSIGVVSATSTTTTQTSVDDLSTFEFNELVHYFQGRGLYRNQATRAAKRVISKRNPTSTRAIARRTEAADTAINLTNTFHSL